MTLHDTKELDDDLGRGTDKDLTLSAALSIDDIVQAVILKHHQSHYLSRQNTNHSPGQRREPFFCFWRGEECIRGN